MLLERSEMKAARFNRHGRSDGRRLLVNSLRFLFRGAEGFFCRHFGKQSSLVVNIVPGIA